MNSFTPIEVAIDEFEYRTDELVELRAELESLKEFIANKQTQLDDFASYISSRLKG